MIPWCLAGSAYSSAVVEWVITSELISSSGLRVPSIASIASIPRCAAVLPPLASCLLFSLLPLFFSFCLLPLASPYLPVFHSFRRWPPGTCRTVPDSPDLSVVSHHSWTPGLLEAHGAARRVWKRRETRSTHLRYLYLYLHLYLTLPLPTLPNRTYLLIPPTPTPTTTTTTGSSATPHYQIRAGTNETIPFDSNSFWTHAASPGTTAFALESLLFRSLSLPRTFCTIH